VRSRASAARGVLSRVSTAPRPARVRSELVFLSASIPKLLAPADFALAVRNYRLLPPRLNGPVATWLPRLELGLACALLLGLATKPAGGLAAAALLVFAGAITINLVRGRRIECGCFSTVSPRSIGWSLVLRDLLLVLLAIIVIAAAPQTFAVDALWSGHARPLGIGEGVAVVLIASSAVLVLLLFDEARRVRQAMHSLGSIGEGRP
jgi:putative oxidoreductase